MAQGVQRPGLRSAHSGVVADISIVVPTHGRADLLDELLRCIENSDTDGLAVEVVIVDSSDPSDRQSIEQSCARIGARLLDGPVDVRRKRNLGIAAATAPVVLFTDSDCRLEPTTLRLHAELYSNPDNAAVLGLTEFDGPETLTWRAVRRTRFLDAFGFARTLYGRMESAPWGTCTNLSVRREVLELLGGFDEQLPFRLGGDDADLGHRINEAGLRIEMCPEAVVRHTTVTWNRFDKVARRAFRWGRTDYHVIFRKRPEGLRLAPAGAASVLSLLVAIALLRVVAFSDLASLALIPSWFALYLFIHAFFASRASADTAGSLPEYCGAEVLNVLFELGTILEGFLHADLRPLYLQSMTDDRQIPLVWDDSARRFWAVYLALLPVVVWAVLA